MVVKFFSLVCVSLVRKLINYVTMQNSFVESEMKESFGFSGQ